MKVSENFAPITIALAGVALVGIVLILISWSAPVLTPIMLGWYLTALTLPGYLWLQKRGVKKGISLLLLIVTILVGGVAIGLLSDFDLARDVVQEAFLCAFRDLRQLREPARFGGAGWRPGQAPRQASEKAEGEPEVPRTR